MPSSQAGRSAGEGISRRLDFWLHADPEAPAIGAVGERTLTRGELAALMALGRRRLWAAGLGPADRVAVLAPGGLDGAIATLQIAGACSIAPLRPTLGAGGWEAALRGLAPAALVVAAEWPEAVAAGHRLGIPTLDPRELSQPDPGPATEPPRPGRQEILVATSGSTGPPKWVRIDQRELVVGSRSMARHSGLTPDDVALLVLPLTHVHGLASGLLLPLLSGGSVIVCDGFEPEQFLGAIADHRVTWYTVGPPMHRALLEQHAVTPLASGHRLRMVRSGSVALPGATIDSVSTAFGVPVIEAYGMSECPHIACNPVDAPRQGSVGRAVVDELRVVDDGGRPVPAGQWGHVVLRGAPVMSGYLDAGESAAAFRDGWLQTGDQGRLDADGYLFLRGRISERINRGGVKVTPADIDAALMTHPAVAKAACFAVPHVSLGEDLAAAVVVAAGCSGDEAEFRGFLAARLEPRLVPSRIVVVDDIPLGATGKIVRATMAQALDGVLYPEYEAPLNSTEEVIVGHFEALLRPRLQSDEKVGRLTNFFLAGGDSLLATQFMELLVRAGWGEQTPALLFDHPTPAAIAAALGTAQQATGDSHVVALPSQGHQAPLYLIHGLTGQVLGLVNVAWKLGARRPILALHNAGFTVEAMAQDSIAALATRYADDILDRHPGGPVHLLGYSAGGWLAHAVAKALLDRGAQIGMLAILDSHAYSLVQLPPGLRLALYAERVRRYFAWLIRSPRAALDEGENRLLALGQRTWNRLAPRRRHEPQSAESATVRQTNAFVTALRRHRPVPLPIAADLFGPARTMPFLRVTWRHYARAGVRCHPMFDKHKDFARPDLAVELAAALEGALTEAEAVTARSSCDGPARTLRRAWPG